MLTPADNSGKTHAVVVDVQLERLKILRKGPERLNRNDSVHDRQIRSTEESDCEGRFMPPEIRSDVIVECYRRAIEARRMADAAADPSERADFLAIQQRWLSLAHDYASGADD
jgi:hypothetical protein